MDSSGKIEVGDIVYSKKGRDKCNYYVVMWSDGDYIGICNGDLRKSDKIKKKKIKHINYMDYNSSYIKNKFISGEKVTNSEIRRAIAEFEEEREKNKSGEEV